jgi:hypothetical protein
MEILHDQDLPMFLWEHEYNTTVYVQKKSPHKIMEDKTVGEAFTGMRPKIGILRISGCPVYIHVSKDKRTNL